MWGKGCTLVLSPSKRNDPLADCGVKLLNLNDVAKAVADIETDITLRSILLLIKNRYPADVLLSFLNQKLANFAAEKCLVQGSARHSLCCLGLVTFHQSLKIKLVKPLHLVSML